MHKAVDLSSTLGDFEYFLKDLIKLARIHADSKTHQSVVPTVGDFVQLLRKHQRSSHIFMHQCAKNDKELTGWYFEWAKKAASQFKHSSSTSTSDTNASDTRKHGKGGAGNLTASLHKLFSSLDQKTQSQILPILDSHSHLLEQMHAQSLSRLSSVIKCPPSKNPTIAKIVSHSAHHSSSRPSSRPSSPAPIDRISTPTPSHTPTSNTFPSSLAAESDPSHTTPKVTSNPGPGAFLARWQALLDATPITPLTQHGPVKAASSPEVVRASAADVDGSKLVEFGSAEARGEKIRVEDQNHLGEKSMEGEGMETGSEAMKKRQRDVDVVIEALGKDFRDLMGREGCYW